MGPGGIAAIIAASALIIIALAVGYAVLRLAKLIDEAAKTVRSVNRITSSAEVISDKVANAFGSIFENSSVAKIIGSIASSAFKRRKKDANDIFDDED